MRFLKAAGFTLAAILTAASTASAQQFKVGASLRNYDFFQLDRTAGGDSSRRDAEFGEIRLMPEVSFGEAIKIESNLVLDMSSPAGSPAAAMAAGQVRNFLPLDYDMLQTGDVALTGYFDRLNVRIHTSKADLVVGRQAITWGVNTFFPALDLFAPFPPTRIDRDYKPGVDAARLTVPIGSHVQAEAIGAVPGSSRRRDGAGAGLLRVSAGPADFGVMAGKFHGDTVAGGFVTANAGGTLLRAEIAWTSSGDQLDRVRRPSFWRGGVGLERQLSSSVNVMAEVAENGYGESDVLGYPAILSSDRMRRGEVGGLGRWHTGTTVNWQFHPLLKLTNMALVNCNDSSAVWIPWLTWSVSSGSEILAGAQFAIGSKPGPGDVPRSEYGSYSSGLLIGFRLYL